VKQALVIHSHSVVIHGVFIVKNLLTNNNFNNN